MLDARAVVARNFPAAWVAPGAIGALPYKLQSLLQRVGKLEDAPTTRQSPLGLEAVAIFNLPTDAASAVEKLHGTDLRTRAEKKAVNDAPPKDSEIFWLQPLVDTPLRPSAPATKGHGGSQDSAVNLDANAAPRKRLKLNGVFLSPLPASWAESDVKQLASPYSTVRTIRMETLSAKHQGASIDYEIESAALAALTGGSSASSSQPYHEQPPPVIHVTVGFCASEARASVAHTLEGEYRCSGTNHGKPVYAKVDLARPCNAFIYFWNELDGKEFCGWWIGAEVGSSDVWGHLRVSVDRASAVPSPPAHGFWKLFGIAEEALLCLRPAPPVGSQPVLQHQFPDGATENGKQHSIIWEFSLDHQGHEDAPDHTSSPSNAPTLWAKFDVDDGAQVEEAWQQWQTSRDNPQDGGGKLQAERGSQSYEIDLEKMMQTNKRTGRQRILRRRPMSPSRLSPGEPSQPRDEARPTRKRSRQEDLETALRQSKEREAELVREIEIHVALKARYKSSQQQLARRCKALKENFEAERRAAVQSLSDSEMWRHMNSSTMVGSCPALCPRPCLVDPVQEMLKALIPDSHLAHGSCRKASSMTVEAVDMVVNPIAWRRYILRKQEVVAALNDRYGCPWVSDIAKRVSIPPQHLEYIELDPKANEVLLLHGTSPANAKQIITQGFDDRLVERALYGTGTYFTLDTCKALEYSKEQDGRRCLLIARVLLGHPYLAQGPMKTHKRPPMVEGLDVLHDSTIAKPGIPNGRPQKQVHWEFIVPSEQAYPELLVHFREQ